MNTWKVILATIVIFGAGVVTGGLLVNQLDRAENRSRRPLPLGVPGGPPGWRVREFETNLDQQRVGMLMWTTRELGLTADQRTQIDAIFKESQERTRKLWDQVNPEFRKELTETHDKICAVLTPEQKTRFEQALKQPPLRGRRPDDLDKMGPRGRGGFGPPFMRPGMSTNP